MDLAIDATKIAEVLLSDGKWHRVKTGVLTLCRMNSGKETVRCLVEGVPPGSPNRGRAGKSLKTGVTTRVHCPQFSPSNIAPERIPARP